MEGKLSRKALRCFFETGMQSYKWPGNRLLSGLPCRVLAFCKAFCLVRVTIVPEIPSLLDCHILLLPVSMCIFPPLYAQGQVLQSSSFVSVPTLQSSPWAQYSAVLLTNGLRRPNFHAESKSRPLTLSSDYPISQRSVQIQGL